MFTETLQESVPCVDTPPLPLVAMLLTTVSFKPVYPKTPVTVLQCPCGPLKLAVETREGKDGKPITGAVSYESVPSYLVAADQTVEVEGRGSVPYDLCFAGTFYAMVNAEVVGIDLMATLRAVWTLLVM